MDSSDSPVRPITLRPFELSDLDDLATWVTDELVSRHVRWETCRDRDEAAAFLRDTILPHPWFRAICPGGACSDDSEPVGFIFATFYEGADRCRAKLSCSVARAHWGRGFGAAATRAAVSELFAGWPHLERLEAHAAAENAGSRRTLEKAGFRRDGVLERYCVIKGKVRDMVVYSFLRCRSKI